MSTYNDLLTTARAAARKVAARKVAARMRRAELTQARRDCGLVRGRDSMGRVIWE